MAIHSKESTPPPTIGKIGPYTVFLTPPPTPASTSPPPIAKSPDSPPSQPRTPPQVVQPPPQQFHNAPSSEGGSVLGFFRNTVVKVQNAHSSLDEYVAHWFGLNQSKYQWALDDYYETRGEDPVEAKAAKDISRKAQSV